MIEEIGRFLTGLWDFYDAHNIEFLAFHAGLLLGLLKAYFDSRRGLQHINQMGYMTAQIQGANRGYREILEEHGLAEEGKQRATRYAEEEAIDYAYGKATTPSAIDRFRERLRLDRKRGEEGP